MTAEPLDRQTENQMEIQAYLCGGGTLEDLARELAICHTRHPEYPNLILFKYDQINGPMNNALM